MNGTIFRKARERLRSLPKLAAMGSSRRLLLIAMAIGVACGIAAAGLIALIDLMNGLFFGHATPEARGIWIIIVPALGGLIVGPIIERVAPETKGHGVPEVMLAVARGGGRIRPRVAVVKALASAITIGSGGSAGREGPIVQIGAAIGSTFARLLGEPREIVRTMVACGAAAGIAASFNAPIAGVIFAMEVILRDFAARAFAAVVAGAVTASVLTRGLLGADAFFSAPFYGLGNPWQMVFFGLLGILSAPVARLFIVVLYGLEDIFEKVPVPPWLKPAIGGLLLGCVGYFLPQVFGTAHAPIESALAGEMALGLAAVLVLAKILATSLTLGSGGSGGVFAPSLFIGAMFGTAFGLLVERLFPEVGGPAGAYALVGMGAVFAGATFAPMSAILIIFEMTHDYGLMLPLMAACIVSMLLSHRISRDTIYTLKLRRRGIDLDRKAAGLGQIRVEDVMTRDVDTVRATTLLSELQIKFLESSHSAFPVVRADGKLVGLVTGRELRDALSVGEPVLGIIAADMMISEPPIALPEEDLAHVASRMHHHRLDQVPVVDDLQSRKLIGIVTNTDLVEGLTRYNDEERISEVASAGR